MATNAKPTCIYCPTEVDPSRGAGDHVIPAALGRFRGDLRFRLICRECNAKIGTLEETLLRSAPEAMFRRFIRGVIKPTGRGKRGGAWVAAKGSEKPKATRDHGDHAELLEIDPTNPEIVRPIDQLVVRDTAGNEHHLVLNPKMTAETLRQKIEKIGDDPSKPKHLYAESDESYEHYKDLIATIYPETSVTDGEVMEAGIHQVKSRTEFRFSNDYYRALAKIAFHYYLVTNRRAFCGDESEFANIRRFIMEGGDHREFFDVGGARFVSPFREFPDGGALLSGVWGHALAADEERAEAVVNIMLFFGPKRLPPSNHIRIAQLNSPIIVPGAQSAHEYIYHDEPDSDGYSGFVAKASVTRIG